jgi:hypothetical protein
MQRENYKKLINRNSGFLKYSCIPLTDKQVKGLKQFCKNHLVPSGNDNKTHFIVVCCHPVYSVAILSTSSGKFAKLKCNFSF